MIQHMQERNAMQNGPGDPPKYTAQDSVNYVNTLGDLLKTEKKIEKLSDKQPKSTIGRAINTYRTMSARTKAEKLNERLNSNPYKNK